MSATHKGRRGLQKKGFRPKPQKQQQQVEPRQTGPGGEHGRIQVSTERTFSGPLPPPEILAKYNDAIPNGAERILVLTESQAAHRQGLEKTVIESNIANERIGQWFAFAIAIIGIIAGTFLVYAGKNAEGLATIFVPLTAIVGAFFYSRSKREQSLLSKWRELTGQKQANG